MRTIVHISDLHFNKIDEALVPKLAGVIHAIRPDILAVSGDFTQHAYPTEFERAAEFVRSLPGVPIFVPGNHDMSFYNVLRRATQRLKLYKTYLTHDLEPFYSDDEVVVMGLNTARISHLRNGRIRKWQVEQLEQRMAVAPPNVTRVLVTHHPFDLPDSFHAGELIGRDVMERVVRCVDVMLAGHMHISHTDPTALRYKLAGHSAIFVQAGTALSTRGRGEANSFQVILTGKRIDVLQYSAGDDLEYRHVSTRCFVPSESGWRADTLERNAFPESVRLLRM